MGNNSVLLFLSSSSYCYVIVLNAEILWVIAEWIMSLILDIKNFYI